MTIALSHGGTTIYSSPSPSNEVLVGTREGVLTIARENSDAEWQVTHRAIPDKHISAMITEPESGLMFAGAFHGSVQMSADGGKSWEPRGNGMTQDNVYSLAARRVDGQRPFVCRHRTGAPVRQRRPRRELERDAVAALRAECAQVEFSRAAAHRSC